MEEDTVDTLSTAACAGRFGSLHLRGVRTWWLIFDRPVDRTCDHGAEHGRAGH
jgi:hypothetical protein